MSKSFYRFDEVMEILGYKSKASVYALLKAGKLHQAKLGITTASVNELMEKGTIPSELWLRQKNKKAEGIMDIERLITNVKNWELRKGKAEYLRHLEGGDPLTRSEAMTAKCYDCCCGYPGGEADSKDCKIETCALYPWMPYREGGVRKSRTLTEEQRQKAGERLKKARMDKSEFQ